MVWKWVFLSFMSCSSKLIESEKGVHGNLICSQLIIRSTGNNLDLKLVSEVEDGLVELSVYLWNLILSSDIVRIDLTSQTPGGTWELLVGVGKPPHTHTLEFGLGTPFQCQIYAWWMNKEGVCECLKYFLCWFFKFPITTVPPLGLKHYLQRPKWKPLTGERHHCFLYQFGGQMLYKLIQLAAAAKALQSCLTLCDSIDGSPPASPFLGFNLKEKQFKGRKEDGELERPKLGVLPWGAKLGWPAGGLSGWLGVSRGPWALWKCMILLKKGELKRIGPTQVSRIAGRFFTSWAIREAERTGGGCQRPITGFKILCRETYLSCTQQSLYLMKLWVWWKQTD